ncbi:MAG: Holliday junction branch migration protein RuvA [Lachnospiraceae bacterium]|nr:Holliday junction branch migration protein RuvA [Lachnospiraceae bacterium]
MIAFIKGELVAVSQTGIVVETQGIGYEIYVPLSVIRQLPPIGEQVKVYTYMHVREDILQLFGFLTPDELEMFKLVITVSGIGPKGALGIFSVMDADTLRFAILSDDAKSIAKAPGIGGKTASKLILELKDKCSLEDLIEPKADVETESGIKGDHAAMNDAVAALTALGYSASEALNSVKRVEITAEMDVEDILRAALKNL